MQLVVCDICGKRANDRNKDHFGMIQFLCQGIDFEYEDVCHDSYKELLSVVKCKEKELKEASNATV